MIFHIIYADGQAFEVELASHEAVEWLLSLDFPNAVLVGEGSQITAWESAAGRLAGRQPVAVVKAIGCQHPATLPNLLANSVLEP